MSLLCRRSKAFAFASVCAAGITIAAGAFDASDNNSIVQAVTLVSKRTNEGGAIFSPKDGAPRKRVKCLSPVGAPLPMVHATQAFLPLVTTQTNGHCASDAEVGDDSAGATNEGATKATGLAAFSGAPDGAPLEREKTHAIVGQHFYPADDNRKSYDGEYNRNRERHGEGTLVFRDGTEYKGHFENDKMKGQGTLKFKSGLVYHGKFDASETFEESGRWTLRLAKELLAVDEPGRLTFPRGNVRRIAQIDSNDGKNMMLSFFYSQSKTVPATIVYEGKMVFDIGATYEGELKGSQPHGKGVLKRTDGLRVMYDGEYQNGKKHGTGKLSHADGYEYNGQWQNGKRHGTGVQRYPEKNLFQRGEYVGAWKNDEFDGEGLLTWSDGKTYTGQFKNGKFNGRGIFMSTHGATVSGIFVNGFVRGADKQQLQADLFKKEKEVEKLMAEINLQKNLLRDAQSHNAALKAMYEAAQEKRPTGLAAKDIGSQKFVYHYTSRANAEKIRESGYLLASKNGASGAGIYTTASHPSQFIDTDGKISKDRKQSLNYIYDPKVELAKSIYPGGKTSTGSYRFNEPGIVDCVIAIPTAVIKLTGYEVVAQRNDDKYTTVKCGNQYVIKGVDKLMFDDFQGTDSGFGIYDFEELAALPASLE